MSLLLDFTSPLLLDASVAGGKGANLARLTQGGFAVPPGFVLPPQAYLTFLAHEPALPGLVRELPLDDPAAMDQACSQLCARMAHWPMPESLLGEVREALSKFPPQTAFSVRSSATAEDLGGAAFAGQHETYLNCIGADDIVARIRDCWVSLWSARAVSYRLQAGVGLLDTAMAVVVQKMAFSRVAGVGFCLNPVTGAPHEQSIDANYGLGESVVGGEFPVDHWLLDKRTGQVKHATIARKTERIVAAATGTRIEPVPQQDAETSCLTEQELSGLSELMRRVEALYGYPQDIEWGIEGDTLWLLQARPVTRIPARWTRDESAERFPSVITPLAWDLVEEGFHQSLSHSFELMGLPPFHGKWFALFDNYVYGNQNAVEIYAEGTASALNVRSVAELVAALPKLRKRYAWVQDLPLAWSRDLDRYLLGLGELMAEPLAGRAIPELWDYVLRVKRLGAEYFLPNIAISITQRTLYKLVFSIIEAGIGKQAAPACFDRLLAYCETKTGFVNKELYRLARKIEQRPALAEKMRVLNGQAFLAAGGFAEDAAIDATFQRFLQDHGHREVEFDPYHPTWLEAPWLVVENLKAMLDSALEDPAEKERALKIAMTETERQLLAGMPEELRFAVQELLRLARVYTALDDIEHYQTTRLTLPFRKGLRALGEALKNKDIVAEPMDVFFAQATDLDQAVRRNDAGSWAKLKASIATEKTAYMKNRLRSPEWELGKSAAGAVSEGGLSGLPGSPGTARGAVFKVLSTDDFASFPQGAILVARTTNPAWTPLFYKAAAIVTESGGPLSHGAVTAREVGLPAVMSVRGVLEALENGQIVTVDGTAGRVII
ncbi:phosphoenolpyruvate synthase [Sulfurimicrobium lacus]|uniref:Phosphoenolpyruvate synthase n=1 Tax=Sulfurimicrobium lacus TaxID=2715678 RepID=A0A6F8V9D4_9PROT|nr:PEP/pyruvate-binding domain-containing protein [Sulfurimicrobium lacus]BCB25930.1 phosphoenolpyruvate synthase [Sulfurimicrobium lacus]